MPDLASIYRDARPALSFELFPPKTDKGVEAMLEHVRQLMDFDPAYFTCTYGAGGSSQSRTLDVIRQVKALTQLPIASHLTCVGSTTDQLRDYLRLAKDAGTDFIVALRGDPPKGDTSFAKTEGGLQYANELVDLIRSQPIDFGVVVAGYPEVHQEAPDRPTDLENLKRKVDAGADAVMTQLFYDNADFYRFRDDCVAAGINVPIIPGLLPVTKFEQAERIAKMCKSVIPEDLRNAMTSVATPGDEFAIGVDHARMQTIDLLDNDVPGIHYYVLNKSNAAMQLLEGLGFARSARR